MKTKIVYISGGETFDVADVRRAFDEVRKTLALSEDTVLFGVPVDSDGVEQKADLFAELPVTEKVEEEIVEKPKRTRKPKAEKPEIKEEPVSELEPERVIPILSVLSGGKAEESKPAPEPVEIVAAEEVEPVDAFDEIAVALGEDLPIDDDKTPKTIEDIFENLTPLPEEKIIESTHSADRDDRADLDDDATLSKLAAEFVESQGISEPAPTARGTRMGKLKNILPFKKAKKDDTSMLGDLFGWAGIAANEDEATTQSFFRASN
ncbi:MAG: hypothetical protein FWE50_00675 [Alphaproteobacteria bacterium]|nr:hypothetical protein [Alphaproteobacteria bacterium]